jgi:hypothetical protein
MPILSKFALEYSIKKVKHTGGFKIEWDILASGLR